MLSILTATAAVSDWDSADLEIKDMEESWIKVTTQSTGAV